MTEIITRKLIKPQDCVVAVCIPTTRAAHVNALNNPENRDFVPNLGKEWLLYSRDVIAYTSRLLPEIEKLGVTVLYDVTLPTLNKLLSDSSYRIFVLIAHWKDDAVEFADGLENISAIVDAVPTDFDGILDLCVCHPVSLALKLRETRPNCVVRFTNAESTPALWLYYFLALFKKLQLEEITYMAAHEFINREFAKRIEKEIRS
jgi:hypothetical protein